MSLLDLTKEYLAARSELDKKYEQRYAGSLGYKLIEGRPFWPYEAMRDTIIISFFMAILFALTAFAPPPLNPPGNLQAQGEFIFPDWYLLWSYGLLKLPEDYPDVNPLLNPAGLSTPNSAIFWGTVLSGVPLIILSMWPFIDRGKERRPVAAPLRTAFGIWGTAFMVTISMYSVNMIIHKVYFPTVSQDPIFFNLKVVTYLLPIPVGVGTYYWLKSLQKGYEYKLNRCYQCWLCDDACPITEVTRATGTKVNPKLNLIYNSYQKQFDGVGLWECLTCGACTAVCPEEIDYDAYVLYMRRVAMGVEKFDPKKTFVKPHPMGSLRIEGADQRVSRQPVV